MPDISRSFSIRHSIFFLNRVVFGQEPLEPLGGVPPDDGVPIVDELLALRVFAAARDGAGPARKSSSAHGAEGVPATTQEFGINRVSVALGTLQ